MNQLTGRRRYRATEHGLVLQVEYAFYEPYKWLCDWRDADVYDVMGFELA